jgi:hypothetical protein
VIVLDREVLVKGHGRCLAIQSCSTASRPPEEINPQSSSLLFQVVVAMPEKWDGTFEVLLTIIVFISDC